MKHFLKLLFFTFLFYNATAQKFEVAEADSWVMPIDINKESEVSKYDVSSGSYYSIIDHQVNLDQGADFTHYVISILTKAGLSTASEIYINYDTSYQQVKFHYLNIWRNGKKIDRLKDLTFEFINNEQQLQDRIYSGVISAYDILEDIRVDDKIEYAYTVYGDNPIFEDMRYRIVPLADLNPIDYMHLRVLHSKEKNFTVNCQDCDQSWLKSTTVEDQVIHQLELSKIEASDIEETCPMWIWPYKYIEFSETNDWKTVNDWALTIFNLDKEPNLDEVFEEIFQDGFSVEDKINALIDYTQNDIRYMGIESGIGSIKPFHPEQVVKQRFGDCKDKSLLLVSLLKQIGIEKAYPVLVNTSLQHQIDQMLPTGQIFNHCIVNYEYNDKTYWIDPSMSEQGGTFKTRSNMDYGKSIVIKANNDDLTKMNINDKFSRTEVLEELTLPKVNEPGYFKTETTLYGSNADYMRSYLEYYSIKDISDQFKAAYAQVYPSIQEHEKVKIKDDIKENVITIKESYKLLNEWREANEFNISKMSFQYEALGVYNYIYPMACEEKKLPVQFAFPSLYKQKTIINLPDKTLFTPEEFRIDNAAFDFELNSEIFDGEKITIEYSFEAKAKEVEAKAFEKVCLDINNAIRNIPLQFTYPVPK